MFWLRKLNLSIHSLADDSHEMSFFISILCATAIYYKGICFQFWWHINDQKFFTNIPATSEAEWAYCIPGTVAAYIIMKETSNSSK